MSLESKENLLRKFRILRHTESCLARVVNPRTRLCVTLVLLNIVCDDNLENYLNKAFNAAFNAAFYSCQGPG